MSTGLPEPPPRPEQVIGTGNRADFESAGKLAVRVLSPEEALELMRSYPNSILS